MSSEKSALSRLLREWALEEGFSRVGIARLEPSAHGDAYLRWLAAGHHGSMAYLARNQGRRLNPSSSFPGARSALCVALQYHPIPGAGSVEGDLWPRVSRYARGQDYHLVMEKRLKNLGERIAEELPGVNLRAYVDHGPLLERELASAAGLGWVGKNTLLIHPDAGSWFFLGELLLDLDLESGSPMRDFCGRCRRCLDACPTGALVEPYLLDSRRCISYWTIEHRGSIPEIMRDSLDGLVFGCDICQLVCPWNHRERVKEKGDPVFALPDERADLGLEELAEATVELYQRCFRRSAMKRAKQEGLQRNAVIAMGQTRRRDYRQSLERVLQDNSSLVVRRHAALALDRLRPQC